MRNWTDVVFCSTLTGCARNRRGHRARVRVPQRHSGGGQSARGRSGQVSNGACFRHRDSFRHVRAVGRSGARRDQRRRLGERRQPRSVVHAARNVARGGGPRQLLQRLRHQHVVPWFRARSDGLSIRRVRMERQRRL